MIDLTTPVDVNQLAMEVERLNEQLEAAIKTVLRLTDMCMASHAEIERLRIENAAMRRVLETKP